MSMIMGGGDEPLKGDAQALIDYVSLEPHVLEGHPNLVMTHKGVVDLRPFLDDPQRVVAVRQAQTTDSFVKLSEVALGDADTDDSRSFFDRRSGRFETVIDFADASRPTHEQHRIEYTPELDPEFVDWAQIDGSPRSQSDFADFIEDHLDAIVDPPGADLLDLILEIRGHKSVTFRSAQRRQDGNVGLAFDETQGVTGGKGELVIPPTITIETPIHKKEDAVRLEAFLRYRITDAGQLMLTVKIKKVNTVVPDSLDRIAERIKPGIPGELITGWHQ